MLLKNIYQWHRKLSLIIALPVLVWAISGFFHPIMTNIKPKIATQFLTQKKIDSSRISLSLQEVLVINKIDSFTNFRLVHIDTNWFYQVQKGIDNEPVYLSTKTGKQLKKGNWLYAQYLAKQYLEGQSGDSGNAETETASSKTLDCCNAATVCVLKNEKGAKINDAVLIKAFNNEYKSINKILPVYKVSFERKDGIRIYVEPTQDRFVLAIDNQRAVFNSIFVLVHTWGWLDFLGKGRLVVEILLTGMAILTTLFGLYIFFSTRSRKANGSAALRLRYGHRITSLCIALFTLAFTFSGAFHAYSKWNEDSRDVYYDHHWFTTKETVFDLSKLSSVVKKPVTNVSLVFINGQIYWQVSTKDFQKKKQDKLMKANQLSSNTVYVASSDYGILKGGDEAYAHYLANTFSGHLEKDIKNTETITKFAGEYGFANKRLPVYKVSYPLNHNERFYVETSTGKLSVRIDDLNMVEGYSFAFLHKHEFLTPLGKGVKDFSTMFWAAAQVAMVAVGIALFLRIRKKKKVNSNPL